MDQLLQLPLHVYPILFIAGIAAGVINTVAGGGSVITLPVLIFAGLEANVANATNRIGVIAQNTTAIWHFRKSGVREGELSWRLVPVAAVGAILGAKLAAFMPGEKFEVALGVLMLFLLVLIIKKPKPKLLKDDEGDSKLWDKLGSGKRIGLFVCFFVLGVYAGFIQAGMGVMVLLVFSYFLRLDLVRANYIKLVVILGLTFVAIATFMLSGVRIDWVAGIAMGAGQMVGASIGSWVAIKKGETWIKRLMIVAILLSSGKLLGVFDLIGL